MPPTARQRIRPLRRPGIRAWLDTAFSFATVLEARVDEIADIKRENHIAVVQPQQWQHVVQRYMKHTEDTSYQTFIEQFLELLHQSSINRQK